jgi:hypothetical protein
MDETSRQYFRGLFLGPLSLVAPTARTMLAALVVASFLQAPAFAEALQLQSKIPLGSVKGRIDHMAFDPMRKRLLIAELGNDSVGVVDLEANKTIHTIVGLAEPQGVGYAPTTDTVYVANARDGSVRLFRGGDYTPAGTIELGNDADNIRFDADANRLLIGTATGRSPSSTSRRHAGLPIFDCRRIRRVFRLVTIEVGYLSICPRSMRLWFSMPPTAKRKRNGRCARAAIFRWPSTNQTDAC